MPEPGSRAMAMGEVLRRMDRCQIVLIYYWGRSGSLFLQSLLDSHPQVLTLPASAMMFFHTRQWDRIGRGRYAQERIRLFCEYEQNQALFDGTKDRTDGLGALGPGRDIPLSVDQAAFQKHMLAILDAAGCSDRRTFFLAAHFAYALARGEEVGGRDTIVYQMHSADPIAISSTLSDFPDRVRALGTVRHPMRALNSHLRMRRGYSREDPAYDGGANVEYHLMVGTGIFAGYYKLQLIGWSEAERYFAVPLLPVKLEDLHADPRGQMEKVAAWLGLRWDDRLLKSTFNGLEFWGDAQAVKPVQGFSTSHTHYQGWQEQFDALDQFVVAGLLGKNFERFGYWELPFWHRPLCLLLILWPAKLERRALALAAGALLRLDHPGQALRSLLSIMRHIADRYDLSYRQFLKSIGWVEKFYLRFVAPQRKLYFRYQPPR